MADESAVSDLSFVPLFSFDFPSEFFPECFFFEFSVEAASVDLSCSESASELVTDSVALLLSFASTVFVLSQQAVSIMLPPTSSAINIFLFMIKAS